MKHSQKEALTDEALTEKKKHSQKKSYQDRYAKEDCLTKIKLTPLRKRNAFYRTVLSETWLVTELRKVWDRLSTEYFTKQTSAIFSQTSAQHM